MPRPTRPRCVETVPGVTYFKPQGVPLRLLEEIVLTVDELEAIRLKDLEDLDGEAAAARMAVSRPTYQRILDRARRKVAEVLVQGKALRVEGGNYKIEPGLRCQYCPQQRESDECRQQSLICPKGGDGTAAGGPDLRQT